MKSLKYNELISINGGECHPTVSSDSTVQGSYGVGWHIGHAIGETISMFKSIFN